MILNIGIIKLLLKNTKVRLFLGGIGLILLMLLNTIILHPALMLLILGTVVVGVIFFLLLYFLLMSPIIVYNRLTVKHYKIKISKKAVQTDTKKVEGGSYVNSYYAIHTAEGWIFKNIDDVSFLKFTSAELQARLKVGQTYVIKTSGRGPIKNIISARQT